MHTMMTRFPRRLTHVVLVVLALRVPVPGGTVGQAAGQAPPAPTAGPDRPVSGPEIAQPLVEPHLVVNPSDPNHLVATAMLIKDPSLEAIDCGIFVSRDRGATWRGQTLGMTLCGDPWLAVFADGRVVFTALSDAGMLLFRSEDGGATWTPEPVRFGRGHDHQMLVVDTTRGQYRGSLHPVSGRGRSVPGGRTRYTVFSARSSDGGRSFTHISHFIPSWDGVYRLRGAPVRVHSRPLPPNVP